MNKQLYIVFEKSLRRQKMVKIIVGSFLLIFSIFGIYASAILLNFNAALATCILQGFIMIIGAFLLRNAYKSYISECNFWSYFFRYEELKIVWVYYHKLEDHPFGIRFKDQNTLFIHLDDGSKACIAMRESDILKVLTIMRKNLPSATFGYSRAKEQLYNIGPDLLRK